ncbi:unnamed protein product [Pelagomonas calceolata]|uniref:NAD(P)-binding domain-containing protein n=1 Tax=Pelagomonas calceolata TaxID=35677 RepID=A0A7S4A1M2_9STRA|nr:unnamed protein product [Pelagomonas calceolata]|mmetsp:Transcript_22445/g.63259  ORF Transcript_22445/g.63259 Transcript_22445/m.63259 type:complete len:497 (-) Transcript_22445:64-1554(-)
MSALDASTPDATAEKTPIVVTGVAGFIGSHCAERLLERGETVIGIDEVNDYYDVKVKEQNVALLRKKGSSKFAFYRGDICDKKLLETIWATHGKPRRVVHMAARAGVRPSIDDPFVYVHSNVEGTTRLLEIAAKYGSDSFVFASSSSVYGGSTATTFSEADAVDHPVSPYAATKKACELLAYTYHHLYNLHIAALRFFTVFGPRGRPDMAPLKFVDKISRGVPIQQFGDGTSSRDYTYVDDVVQGIILALDTPAGYQVYNLGNGSPTKLTDFISLVEKETGKKASIELLPEQPGDVPRTCADISKARKMLGYDPKTPFADGIRKLVEWYREAHPHVGETPECIARAAMERRLMAAARRKDREQMLDPELLTLFRAARQSRGNGRDRAHTVGRSNPSTLRPRITSRSFDDLCLLERSASERPPSPVGEARAGKLQRDVLQGFVETVREKPTHPSIPTLAMVRASRSSALSLRSPKMADVFAPTPPTNPTSFKHGPAP